METQLRKYRLIADLTQQQMADRLGVKKRTYGSWERDEAEMSFPWACACADILECTLDELAGRKSVRDYTDPRQEQLNGCFESLNDESKTQVSEMVKSIAADPARRIEKDGQDLPDSQDVAEIA